LVIARSGALTVSELLVTATPSILIPLPHAIDDHQTMNAKVLTVGGAAQLLPQPELATGGLSQMLTQFLAAPVALRRMSEAAHAMANPTATDVVVDVLTEVAHAA
jgi:UDP-N-acetylglucosamine--N-acetylmuramyl-(pentapeptide) pyrophosphoryl-undecaprenol N-acetylglucosamine transferase